MTEAEVLRVLGPAKQACLAGTEGMRVLEYRREYFYQLWVGLRDDRVAWLRAEPIPEVADEWRGLEPVDGDP